MLRGCYFYLETLSLCSFFLHEAVDLHLRFCDLRCILDGAKADDGFFGYAFVIDSGTCVCSLLSFIVG